MPQWAMLSASYSLSGPALPGLHMTAYLVDPKFSEVTTGRGISHKNTQHTELMQHKK
jgi:hypothetical protein